MGVTFYTMCSTGFLVPHHRKRNKHNASPARGTRLFELAAGRTYAS